jgi:hypothetical protein
MELLVPSGFTIKGSDEIIQFTKENCETQICDNIMIMKFPSEYSVSNQQIQNSLIKGLSEKHAGFKFKNQGNLPSSRFNYIEFEVIHDGLNLYGVNYFTFKNGGAWVFSLTANEESFDQEKQTLNNILESIKWL